MEITSRKIEELAPNADAAKNGRDLVAKNKFSNLKIDADKTLIWGECAGSGKNPYYVSADFMEPAAPVFRCNCPSRQFPCKHGIGLLYAFEKAMPFATDFIPQDINDKRNKIEKKQEKKAEEKETLKEKAAAPKKINKAAAVKKIDAQLSGIETAKKILTNITQNGLSSIDSKEKKNLQAQVKELGNYYINGIQTAFNDLLLELDDVKREEYTLVIDQVNFIAALLKKATEYLNQRKENPELPPEINSAIEEQIGTIWKLTDLIPLKLYEENAELLQLSFNSYNNEARKEFVDEGAWLNLKSGKIYKTKNYRPYKAVKYIKEDNSIADVLQLKELYVYPGEPNPRIRWEPEARTDKAFATTDIATIHSHAAANYAELIKSVKNIIKNPLMDKNPLVLVQLHKATLHGDNIVIEDATGNKITLVDTANETAPTATILKQVLPADASGMSLLVLINNNIQTGLMTAHPLTLITADKLIKLLY